MNDLLNLIIYIFKSYPKVEELSKPRLVKLIYLIDWKHTIEHGKQATPIKWYFNHYGPYVDTIIDLIKQRKDIFLVESHYNMYGGGISDKIKLVADPAINLDKTIKESADFIINNTANKSWNEFINLVYSTFPVMNNSKYTYLNLKADAQRFKQYKQRLYIEKDNE